MRLAEYPRRVRDLSCPMSVIEIISDVRRLLVSHDAQTAQPQKTKDATRDVNRMVTCAPTFGSDYETNTATASRNTHPSLTHTARPAVQYNTQAFRASDSPKCETEFPRPISHTLQFESLNPDHLMAYCDRCERWFPHKQALWQHEDNSNAHWPCDDCDLDFESYDARRWHYMQSPNHCFCGECDRHFNSEVSRTQHMSAKHWYCRVHNKVIS